MTGTIEVLRVRPVDWGNKKALVDVRVGPWEIRGCSVVQQPGQEAWAALPQQQDKSGRWWPVVKCSDDRVFSDVKAAILAAWEQQR